MSTGKPFTKDFSENFEAELHNYYSKTSAATRFTSLLAAGDYFFMENCVKERALFNAAKREKVDSLEYAKDAEACLYKTMKKLLASPCSEAFLNAARCMDKEDNKHGGCTALRNAVFACTIENKMVEPSYIDPETMGLRSKKASDPDYFVMEKIKKDY